MKNKLLYIPVLILSIVASVNLYNVKYNHFTRWKGISFGMYSEDSWIYRRVKATPILNSEIRKNPSFFLHKDEWKFQHRDVMCWPTQKNFKALADSFKTVKWAFQNYSGTEIDVATSFHPEELILKPDSLLLELYNVNFYPDDSLKLELYKEVSYKEKW